MSLRGKAGISPVSTTAELRHALHAVSQYCKHICIPVLISVKLFTQSNQVLCAKLIVSQIHAMALNGRRWSSVVAGMYGSCI
jgi:hypothetical protein